MRSGLALLLAAALAAAEDDAELARTVEALVRELGAPTAEARTLARFRLASLGDRIRPLLERVESDDPEVRRAIRQLTRTVGDVQIELLPKSTDPLPIGAPLVLDVRILNNTEQTLRLLTDEARQGAASPFRVRIGSEYLAPIGFDQVDWGDGSPTILPGAVRKFRLSFDRSASPLRRPALYRVSVLFDGSVGRSYGEAEEDAVEIFTLVRETAPIQIHVMGRKADDLEQALRSADEREREAAAKELSIREDEAVAPVLRRHVHERPLRLAAVRRLAAVGAKEDFGVILEATQDEDAAVRRAAVIGLRKYPTAKARSRLLLLAPDPDVQAEVIRALQGHKHPSTVGCYLKLLESGKCTDDSCDFIRRTLFDWTGMTVSQRRSEVRAFRDWWEKNAVQWAAKNASDK